MGKTRKAGQTMAEYAIVLTVVITAIVAMQIYVKRSLQGKVKAVSDNVDTGSPTKTLQYEPYYVSSDYTVDQDREVGDTIGTGGVVKQDMTKDTTTRTGSAATSTDRSVDSAWQ